MNETHVSEDVPEPSKAGILPRAVPLKDDRYQRLPEVERQIRETCNLSSKELEPRVQVSNRKNLNFLKEETLVYLTSLSIKTNDKRKFNLIEAELYKRCIKYINGNKYLRRYSPNKKEEIINEVMEVLINDLLGEKEYLQVRFFQYLNSRIIDVTRRAHNNHQNQNISLDKAFLNTGDSKITLLDTLEDESNSIEKYIEKMEREELICEALSKLPKDLQELLILKYVYDIPVHSKKSEKTTLSKYYGVSDRTIRTRLQKADEILKDFRESRSDEQ